MRAIVILVVLGFASVAHGLNCTLCLNCEEINANTTTLTCTEKNSLTNWDHLKIPIVIDPKEDTKNSTYHCYKAKVPFADGSLIVRGCTTLKECKTDGQKILECDVCDKDNCNFAPGLNGWTLSSIVLIAIVKMFF